jgi:hypothetical protein
MKGRAYATSTELFRQRQIGTQIGIVKKGAKWFSLLEVAAKNWVRFVFLLFAPILQWRQVLPVLRRLPIFQSFCNPPLSGRTPSRNPAVTGAAANTVK